MCVRDQYMKKQFEEYVDIWFVYVTWSHNTFTHRVCYMCFLCVLLKENYYMPGVKKKKKNAGK